MTQEATVEKTPSPPKTTATKALEVTKRVRPMIKEWARRTHEARQRGDPVAYIFIGSLYESVLRAMGILTVGTENYAGVCAAKQDAQRFLDKAHAEGYATHLCSYARTWIGFDAMFKELGEMPPNAPDGGLARPTVMLGTGMMICDLRYKAYQASQRYIDVPVHVMNLLWPPTDAISAEVDGYYIKFITEELRELIEFLEKHTDRKLDLEKLRRMNDLSEKTQRVWYDAYELRKAVPAPMPSGDGFTTMVPGSFYAGTQDALDFYQDLYNEVKYRVDNKIGVIPDEKYRIMWAGGLPPWFALNMFDYFASLGAVFPYETTYAPGKPVDIPDSVTDPLERMAWKFVKQTTTRHDKAQKGTGHPEVERLLELAADYKIDGLLFHRAYTCRTVHAGQMYTINVLREYTDIPILVLEGDIVDSRYYSVEEVKRKIDAFIDVVDAYKKKKKRL